MVVTAVSVSAEVGHREVEVLEDCLVGVAAEAVAALADQQEVVDTTEMMVLEVVAQEAAITEVALDVGWVDQEAVDMAAEGEDTAVDSVDA